MSTWWVWRMRRTPRPGEELDTLRCHTVFRASGSPSVRLTAQTMARGI